MRTLKQFLQNLSYKANKKVASHSKGLLLALKTSKIPHKLTWYVIENEAEPLCDNCKNILTKAIQKP